MMTDAQARARFAELYAKCKIVNAKPGGLLSEEATEFRLLAERLGVPVTWRWFNLLTWKWEE